MSCPFVAKAVVKGKDESTTTIRLCMAMPRERDNDPEDLPPPSVCFSESDFLDCFHYKVMQIRGEPGVEQSEELLPVESPPLAKSEAPDPGSPDFKERRHPAGDQESGKQTE